MDNDMKNSLMQQWICVTDARGQQRLEARWVTLGDLSMASFASHASTAAHAA